ncbi:methyltransferase domain-containing protein [Nesterenkonia cremea]|uniref:rRNA (Guanine-N1)-methyltransferase n=1 Tax=Nesterenkonia cremea TaxID=1882340 RepID=A0A917ASL3_9MICC|nr:methyltransferase domain-containing protein [Nesterenkonia cremea]GGE72337.1 rRNA (guanine-N1)-methyltransferase [Nesterenkonia cremea]
MNDLWPLSCPHCSASLSLITEDDRLHGLDCSSGHHFTAAKQGYVNLLVGRGSSSTPDTPEMIMARERVQQAGLFDLVTRKLTALRDEHAPEASTLLDAGTGTGHYLHEMLSEHPELRGIGLDLSSAGLKRAAKHERTLALAWDLWTPLPLKDHSVDVVLNVFAPRNPEEYARVLRTCGAVVVVTPRSGHLAELAEVGLLNQQEDKHESLLAQMRPVFGEPTVRTEVTCTLPVEDEEAADLVMMGPAGHHRGRRDVLTAVEEQEIWSVTVDVDMTVWSAP